MLRPRAMKLALPFLAFVMCAQSASPATQPSPMEALAGSSTVRTLWSGELGRLEQGNISAVVTALILEDGGRRISGVAIDLSGAGAKERIYLDEEATERTRAAMIEIMDAVARHPMGNGCMGAKEFWPGYDWPWNKYHELNVDYCGDDLVLYGRGREGAFRFAGKTPDDLAAVLASAQEQLKTAPVLR